MRIYLTGFMGSGKTTVGRHLAESLGLEFMDTDRWVEKTAGETIAEIFSMRGETAFRELEHQALLASAHVSDLVVATGGGAMLSESNREVLGELGTTVWLDLPFELIEKRLDDSERKHRPLAGDRATLSRLFRERLTTYRCSDHRIAVAAGDRAGVVAGRIRRLLKRCNAISDSL